MAKKATKAAATQAAPKAEEVKPAEPAKKKTKIVKVVQKRQVPNEKVPQREREGWKKTNEVYPNSVIMTREIEKEVEA